MSNEPARKYKIGDVVIWTDYADRTTQKRGTVRAYVDPEPGGDYDLAANGPLYDVQFEPGQHWQFQVAEVDLSPSDGSDVPLPDGPITSHEEHQGETEPGALEKLRARRRADDEVRDLEWLVEHGGDPDDPFDQTEMENIIAAAADQLIYEISRQSEDGTWLKLTYLMRPPMKLIDITMGNTGTDEPAVSLIISDTEAYDLIGRIIGAIGPPDPEPGPVD